MTLAEYLKCTLTVVGARLLLNLHAVACPFCTFYVEVNWAFALLTLYCCANLIAFLATDDASMVELRKIHLMHFNRSLRRDDWSLHPQGTAMMYPVVERVSQRCCSEFKSWFVALEKVGIVLGRVMVLFLVLIEVELKLFLLFDYQLRCCQLFCSHARVFLSQFDCDQAVVIFLQDTLTVATFSLQ